MERQNGGAADGGDFMFSDEEVREISGLSRCGDHVAVTCGCTSHRYGDAVGRLRVFASGDLEISCECTPGCQEGRPFIALFLPNIGHLVVVATLCLLNRFRHEKLVVLDKLTPAAFEKHSGRETARKWKNNVWVIADGEKVPLSKTVLLKYYNQASNANGSNRSHNGRVCHRDEFVRCTSCHKERRFRLRTKEECRAYHDVLADGNWKCSDMPDDKVTCEDDEERASRRVYRGCSRSPTCKGCTSCVCFGCDTCRFSDCSCQTCIDFTRNAKA
ncbi:hypothetical protein RJ639_027674 [Escallonia herrerae]|uniref:Protein ULTRAPETALA 1 n=1 Tax=Escallonia herrerae TaxID=1293975 RepID=A0AA89AZT8_9ASTE|nr:hypothetical protein RJ639_046109 [Escallonia herrerae]KAK3039530.1 hypothetical protein RJ639_027674 [Escallonia herrerae]